MGSLFWLLLLVLLLTFLTSECHVALTRTSVRKARRTLRIPGDYRCLAIPVLIPNTVVKQASPMIVLCAKVGYCRVFSAPTVFRGCFFYVHHLPQHVAPPDGGRGGCPWARETWTGLNPLVVLEMSPLQPSQGEPHEPAYGVETPVSPVVRV